MTKDFFEKIEAFKGKEIPLDAYEFILLTMGSTAILNNEGIINTNQQTMIIDIVSGTMEGLLEEPETAKKIVETSAKGVDHARNEAENQKLRNKQAKELLKELLNMM